MARVMQQEATHTKAVYISPRSGYTTRINSSPKQQTLRESVERSLQNYFSHLDGQEPANIYEMVLAEVEAPLLATVMTYTRRNQCKAAEILGMSRGTLRKKLQQYDML